LRQHLDRRNRSGFFRVTLAAIAATCRRLGKYSAQNQNPLQPASQPAELVSSLATPTDFDIDVSAEETK
jgi:hypothetical protein